MSIRHSGISYQKFYVESLHSLKSKSESITGNFDSLTHFSSVNIYKGPQMKHVGYLSLYHFYLSIGVAYCFTTIMMLLTIHG